MARFQKPTPPHIMTRRPVTINTDKEPDDRGYSSYEDDDAASPEELLKYRRRMNAEGFTFSNYLKFKEGATAAIYDGSKGKDFQWEGKPKSMIKPKKRLS